jgi:hypothetical protein
MIAKKTFNVDWSTDWTQKKKQYKVIQLPVKYIKTIYPIFKLTNE